MAAKMECKKASFTIASIIVTFLEVSMLPMVYGINPRLSRPAAQYIVHPERSAQSKNTCFKMGVYIVQILTAKQRHAPQYMQTQSKPSSPQLHIVIRPTWPVPLAEPPIPFPSL